MTNATDTEKEYSTKRLPTADTTIRRGFFAIEDIRKMRPIGGNRPAARDTIRTQPAPAATPSETPAPTPPPRKNPSAPKPKTRTRAPAKAKA